MEKNTDKITFFFFMGKAEMHLSRIYKKTLAFLQFKELSIYAVFHFSGEDSDQFNIIVPVIRGAVIRILRKKTSADIGRISGNIIADFF